MEIFNSEQVEIFEAVWLSENKGRAFGEGMKLKDDDYIDYIIWEDINWKDMSKKHMPTTFVMKGINPNLIFHGGCLGCLSQRKHGVNRCKGCTYFKPHNKQSLFIPGEDSAKMENIKF